MKKHLVKRPSLTAQRKLNHDFGGTHFPYYTENISPQYFSVFANSTNRPLVYRRGANLSTRWGMFLIRETAQSSDGVEVSSNPDLVRSDEFVWNIGQNKAIELQSCYDVAEKVLTFSTDGIDDAITMVDSICATCRLPKTKNIPDSKSIHIEDNYHFTINTNHQKQVAKDCATDMIPGKNENYSVDIVLYPNDALFLPSGWKISMKPLEYTWKMGSPITKTTHINCTSEAILCRHRVLVCTLKAYMEPLKRCGHFSTSEKLTLREYTEDEFLRKNIRKQVRWDEIKKGCRKIF